MKVELTKVEYEVSVDVKEIADAIAFLIKAVKEKMPIAEILTQYAIITKAIEGLDEAKQALSGEYLANSVSYLGQVIAHALLKKK